ncbi:hypothetical protein Tco_1221987 [Tanacetum coccineum]
MGDTVMELDTPNTLCFQLGGVKRSISWRQFILAMVLHTKEEIAPPGFEGYWTGSEREIPDKGDLKDYWIEISSDRDLLGPTPSYVHIRDPMRRLCHKMISYTISGRGQGSKKVTGLTFSTYGLWIMGLLMSHIYLHVTCFILPRGGRGCPII